MNGIQDAETQVRLLRAEERIEVLESVLWEFVQWFDYRYPKSAKAGKDLPGVTLVTLAEKARKLVE